MTKLIVQMRGMIVVFLLMLIPFGFLFYYTDINVKTALLNRKLKRLKHQKELLTKKNRTLRDEIAQQSREGDGATGSERKFRQNKIVRIRLSEEPGSEETP